MKIAALIYVLAGIVVIAAGPDAARAEPQLPADVHALSTSETTLLYSDKTIDYGTVEQYFAPDGSLIGYTKNHKYFARGQWRVKDNEICTWARWRRRGETRHTLFRTCSAWYGDGHQYWTQVTKGADRGQIFKGNASLVSEGDHVSNIVCRIDHGHCH